MGLCGVLLLSRVVMIWIPARDEWGGRIVVSTAVVCFCLSVSAFIVPLEVKKSFDATARTLPKVRPSQNQVLLEPPEHSKRDADGSTRIFVHVTPLEMASNFADRTDNQANARVAPYLLKWIALSGVIQKTSTDADGTITVELFSVRRRASTAPVVQLRFAGEWREQLSLLGNDDIVSAVCQISKIELTAIAMDRCELIDK